MKNRLASRKFIVVVLGLVTIATARWTGADPQTVGLLCSTYIGAEGTADALTRWRGEPEPAE